VRRFNSASHGVVIGSAGAPVTQSLRNRQSDLDI